jgi:hypothetical protein
MLPLIGIVVAAAKPTAMENMDLGFGQMERAYERAV